LLFQLAHGCHEAHRPEGIGSLVGEHKGLPSLRLKVPGELGDPFPFAVAAAPVHHGAEESVQQEIAFRRRAPPRPGPGGIAGPGRRLRTTEAATFLGQQVPFHLIELLFVDLALGVALFQDLQGTIAGIAVGMSHAAHAHIHRHRTHRFVVATPHQ
jgi:hypothetical protein